jgi:hypothetical protein
LRLLLLLLLLLGHAREQKGLVLEHVHLRIKRLHRVKIVLLRKERLELSHLIAALPVQRVKRLVASSERGSSRSGPRIAHHLVVSAVQEGALVQRMEHPGSELRKRMLVADSVKVRVAVLALGMLGLVGQLGARDGALHELDQVRHSSQEEFMVVRVAVGTLGAHSLASPTVRLANEARELGMIKIRGDHFHLEFTGLVNLPRASMGMNQIEYVTMLFK